MCNDRVGFSISTILNRFSFTIGLNQVVTATSANNLMLLPTPLNSTYSCSVETQVGLVGNETNANIANIYLRITGIEDLQAFIPSGKMTPSKLTSG